MGRKIFALASKPATASLEECVISLGLLKDHKNDQFAGELQVNWFFS